MCTCEPAKDSPFTTTQHGYEVLFVGLACFVDQAKGKRVLLPNGMNPGPNVTPHFAYLGIDRGSIVEQKGWFPSSEAEQDLMESGLFRLPKCRIRMTGAQQNTGLNTAGHDPFLPSLAEVDPAAVIDPDDADAVADILLTSGTLTAFRATDSDDPSRPNDVAVMSRLHVQENGPVEVTVEPLDGTRKRTLTLRPGTSIAVANIAFPDEGLGLEHFSIYSRLTKTRQLNGQALPPDDLPPKLEMDHPLFSLGISIVDASTACGNQGCCVPKP